MALDWRIGGRAVSDREPSAGSSVFVAYPGSNRTGDTMGRLAEELRDSGREVFDWTEPVGAGFLFESVRRLIDVANVTLAETTHGNANVLFELGYAIGADKTTFQLVDSNAATPLALPPLEPVAQIRYENRADIREYLEDVEIGHSTLHSQMGLRTVREKPGSLYVVPARRAGDLNDAILSISRDSPLGNGSIDLDDSDYNNLTSQAHAIAEAAVFVGILVADDVKEASASNAQMMLYAGIAAGLGKRYVLLAQQPQKRLLDLGENLIAFESESEARAAYSEWIRATAANILTNPTPVRTVTPTGPLDGLFLGNLDARADFELPSYFIQTPEFQQARNGDRHLFVGSKGSGKTAMYETLSEEFSRRQCIIVSIAPASFEFPRLAAVFEEHLSHAHWEFVYGSFWRYVLVTEILRAVGDKFMSFLLREAGSATRKDPTKPEPLSRNYAQYLIDWLEDNEGLLALDFTTRVSTIAAKLSEVSGSEEERRAQYEDILQNVRMYEVQNHLRTLSRKFEIRLLADDLDRNWSPQNESSKRLIITLLGSIHDLMDKLGPTFKPAVFVRRDVYRWLFHDDPEILRRDPAELIWTDEGLERMVAERIKERTDSSLDQPRALWGSIFPSSVDGKATSMFVAERTLKRPRDVIQFCQKATEAAQRAGRTSVSEDDLHAAWEGTGEAILAQLEIEYRFSYPGIATVALSLMDWPTRTPWRYARERLEESRSGDLSLDWLPEEGRALGLLEALYTIGVVGIKGPGRRTSYSVRRSFEESRPMLQEDSIIEIHPALWRYLGCGGEAGI